MSDQATRLPSLLSIVKDFMIENGFSENHIGLTEYSITYGGWELGGTEEEKFYIIPFKTNEQVYIDPADPVFFDKLREVLAFPKPDTEWGSFWYGPCRYVEDLVPPNFR